MARRLAWSIKGATGTKVFQDYVREVMFPTLAPVNVIMDNLSPHKDQDTIAFIQKNGAQAIFLPAYSPFQTISKMWRNSK
jgi:transposase